jgi:hypothetical protein
LLLEASKDLRLVQKQLGHSRPTTTAVYAGVVDERMTEAVNSMEQLTRSALKSKKQTGIPAPEILEPVLTEPSAVAAA